ncbi:MAG: flippase-like domain-containing protein [Pseudomonadales bacterium]|nr:flippase-like domain-containing protein [Pseudomonadales bacterium]
MKSIKPIIKLLVSIVIAVVFLIFVEHYVGWAKLLTQWSKASPVSVLVAVMFVFMSYIARSARLYYYFEQQINGRFLICTKLMLQHNFLNNILPMRTGEVSFPLLMRSYFQTPLITSVAALLWFRLLDFYMLLGIAGGSIIYFRFGLGYLAVFIALWLLCSGLLYTLVNTGVKWMMQWDTSSKLLGFMRDMANKLEPGLPKSSKHFLTCWIATILSWSFKLLAFVWVLLIFVDCPFIEGLFGVIGGELTSILPVHGIGGLGTYEAGIVAALLPFAVEQKQAITGAVNVHLFLLGNTLLGGVISIPLRELHH